ncbi:PRD domain-containing protein, partial [Clostridioides difficile]
YKNAYKCIEKLDEFIHKKYNYDLTDEEKLYLTIHVERVVSKSIKADINPNN